MNCDWVQVLQDPDEVGSDYTDEDQNRVEVENVARVQGEEKHVKVAVTPILGDRRVSVPWIADSGVRLSIISEKHMKGVVSKNPQTKLLTSNVRFRPYSTDTLVPLLGKCSIFLGK